MVVRDDAGRIGGLDAWRGILVLVVALSHFATSTTPSAAFTPAYDIAHELTTDQGAAVAAGLISGPQLAIPLLSGFALVPTSTRGTGIDGVRISVASGPWLAATMNLPTPGLGLSNPEFTRAGWQVVLPDRPLPDLLVPVRVEVTATAGEIRIFEGGVRWRKPESWIAGIRWAPIAAHAAVDQFFVISGFLITMILVRTPRQPGYLRTFWARRALRILPLAWALVALTWVLQPGYREHLPAFAFFFANFVKEPVAVLGPMWSLGVEEQFYLVYPLLFWFIPRRHVWWMVGGLCLLFTAIRLYTPSYHLSGLYLVDTATHLRAIALAAGGWIALVCEGLVPRPRACVAVFIVWCLGWAWWGRLGILDPIVLAGAVALLYRLARRPVEDPAWLGFLGRRCYGIYLLHVPMIIGVVVFAPWLPLPGKFIVWASLTIGLAAVSYRYLERPLLSLAPRMPTAAE